MVEVTAKRRLFLVTSVTPIPTLKVMHGIVWTAARHRAECQPYTWEKSKNPKYLLAAGFTYYINEGGTAKMRKQRHEKKWENGRSTKKVEKTKKRWNGPASNRRRRCWGGNFWEAREVPTEHAQEIDLKKYLVCLCPLPHDNHAANYRTVVVPGRICQRGVWCDKLFCLDKRECLY